VAASQVQAAASILQHAVTASKLQVVLLTCSNCPCRGCCCLVSSWVMPAAVLRSSRARWQQHARR
jgi:hypothetical protein